jgi:antitoxin component of MazEF toxin-antitoxin module
MKLYKKVLKAFGGAGLYIDKCILKHLGITAGDEVVIELVDDKVVITKPCIDAKKIKELLDANERSKRGI